MSFLEDLKSGFRQLWLHPRISLAILLFLGLGSGVNCAVFTLVDAVLLKPPAYVDPQRTVLVWNRYAQPADDRAPLSPPAVDDVARETGTFQAVGAYARQAYELNGGDEPERIYGAGVSAGFFAAFGVRPLLGRVFLPAEQVPGRDHVALLSSELWRSRFGSDPRVLDRPVTLNGEVYQVVGVLPPAFKLPGWAEVWTPLALDRASPTYNRGNEYLNAIALLRPGVGVVQARSRMAALARVLAAAEPATYPPGSGFGMTVEPLRGALVEESRPVLLLLFAAVACVLLIACANTATLLLVRAIARGPEIAVRAAVGATRWQLVRQLLVESLIPALLGGVAGLAIAHWLTRLLLRLLPFQPPGAERIGIDARVLAYSLAVSLAAGILSGLAPAVHTFRSRLRTGAEGAPSGVRGGRLLGGLAAAQIALTFVLLAATALLARSFGRLTAIDPGFDPRGVLTLKVNPPRWRYQENAQYAAFYDRLLGELRGLQGAKAVGTTSIVPMTSGSFSLPFVPRGKAARGEAPQAEVRVIGSAYFQAMRIQLQAGRAFAPRDREGAEPVAILDRALAERVWPGENAIGKQLSLGNAPAEGPWRTVVGVVATVKDARLSDPPSPHLYLPFSQYPMRNLNLVVRAAPGRDPRSLIAPVKAIVARLDPRQPVDNVKTLEELLASSLAPSRFALALVWALAAVASLLVAYGIAGIVAYSIAQSRRELGIRLALGAEPRGLLSLLAGKCLRFTLAGIALGGVAAAWTSRSLRGLLFEVSANDPLWSYLCAATALLATAGLAVWLASRGELRSEPIALIRDQRGGEG